MTEELDRKAHWERVYTTKGHTEVSWYQENPQISLDLIALAGTERSHHIIDIGGGASTLVDKLIDQGFQNLTVLDISQTALQHAKQRIGAKADAVTWLDADVTRFTPATNFDLWHDRAVFHFLTDRESQKAYVKNLSACLKPNGHVIIATFALDGPPKCSGLEVAHYDEVTLQGMLSDSFHLVKSIRETHVTPFQTEQKFIYCLFKRL